MSAVPPITQALRDAVGVRLDDLTGEVMVTMRADEFRRLCDQIDAADANLARELDEAKDMASAFAQVVRTFVREEVGA